MAHEIGLSELKSLLRYDQDSGEFFWLVSRGRFARPGKKAGCLLRGYVSIIVNSRPYMAHRLAWLYVNGEWPSEDIDHRDGVRSNNRISNLRDVSRAVNMQNQKKQRKGKALFLGVSKGKAASTFRARITIDTETKYLGTFQSEEEAHAAYLAAKRQMHAGNML